MEDKNTTKYGLTVNWDFARLASDEQIERWKITGSACWSHSTARKQRK
jgi:hypothetical protein